MKLIIREIKDKNELDEIFRIRKEVFVKGQNVPKELEIDGEDDKATHIIVLLNNKAIGCARIRFVDNKCKLERIAILNEYQGKGYGKKLVQFLIKFCMSKKKKIYMYAQYYLKDFYSDLGFKEKGEIFEEAGIKHIEMVYEMKKVYLVHGWSGSSDSEPWFKWLKEQLSNKIKIYSFDMPDTDNPKIDSWVNFLQKNIKIDEETYFIGHSIGCQAIMRYLEKLDESKEIAGCIFVAGWFNLNNLSEEEKQIAKTWIETKINFDKIKKHTDNFLVILSDNDPYVPLTDKKIFENKLDAKVIIKHEEHFNNTKEIKEILEFIK